MKSNLNIIILTFLFIAIHANKQPKPISINQTTTQTLQSGQSQIYSIQIKSTNITDQQYLYFIITPTQNQFYEQSSIQLYRLNMLGKPVILANCTEIGIDSCFIPKNIIKLMQGEKLYAKVNCTQNCSYKLYTYWDKSYPMKINSPIQLDFQDSAYAKHFFLDFSKQNLVDFIEIRILLTAKTFLQGTEPIHLMVNYNSTGTPSQNKADFKGIHLWDDGLGVFITKQELKQFQFRILIEGPAQNKLILQAVIIKQYANNLKFNYPTFDHLKKSGSRIYELDFSSNILAKQQDIYVKVSGFTGSINIQIYEDIGMKNLIHKEPFVIFGDSQYKLAKSHRDERKLKDKVYVNVYCRNGQCTYMINCFYKKQNFIRLSQDVVQLSELKPKQIDYYYVQVYNRRKNKQFVHQKLLLNLLKGSNNIKVMTSVCIDDQIVTCLPQNGTKYNEKLNQKYNTLKQSEVSKSGSTIIYDYKIEAEKFQKTNISKITKLDLLIMIANADQVQQGQYSITFIETSKIRKLKQNKPIQQRVSIGEVRYYQFKNKDPEAIQIRFHVVSISGQVSFLAKRKNPINNQFEQAPIFSTSNLIVIKDKIQQIIYIVVNGNQNSFFSLTAQVIRKQTSAQQQQSFNYVFVSMDIQHQVIMAPLQKQAIVFIPYVLKYQIQVYCILPIQVCGSFNQKKFPMKQNCQFKINGSYIVESKTFNPLYIGIYNPNQKQNVLVSVKYTDATTCDIKKTGQIWSKLLTSFQKYCVTYIIENHEQLQIIVNLDNIQYNKSKIYANIGNAIVQIDSASSKFSKKQLQSHCNSLITCNITIDIQTQHTTKINIVMQHIDKQIVLLDGIAQKVKTVYGPNTSRKFKYIMTNKKNTTIMLESKLGYYHFYVNLINMTTNIAQKVYPNKQKKYLTSQTSYYSLYNYLVITQDHISKINCSIPCVALISVYQNDQNIHQRAEYVIEATQQFRFLKQRAQAVGYLQKHSVAYYSYYFPKQNGSLIITLTSQNNYCAQAYLAKGQYERPSKKTSLVEQQGSQLIYYADKPELYSITVEAFQNCDYTISVSSSKFKIHELTTAVFKDVKIKQNQLVFFYYHSVLNQSFKIMSFQQSGQVLISANQIDSISLQNLDQFINNTDTFDTSLFTWSNQPQVLSISNNDKNFCVDCYYFFVVKGLRLTQTSIIIYTKGTQIPLDNNKIVYDKLNTQETIKYRSYDFSSQLNLTLKVYYGHIKVSIQGISDKVQIKQFYKTQKQNQVWVLKVKKGQAIRPNSYIAYSPLIIMVEALGTSLYELSLKSNENVYSSTKLKIGYPTYVWVDKKQTVCYTGLILYDFLQLIISGGYNLDLSDLKTTVYVQDKKFENVKEEIYDNTKLLILNFFSKNNQTLNKQYKICFDSQKALSFTIVPTGNVTYIPEKTYYYIRQQKNFTLSPEGKLILQVFQCYGTSTVLLSSNFNKLNGTKSQINHWKKFGQNYVVQLQHYGPAYLNVNGRGTLIKWIHVNEQKGVGIGYYSFRIPHYYYQISDSKLIFRVEPMIRINNNFKFMVNLVKYTIVLGSNKTQLRAASQCNIIDQKLLNISKYSYTASSTEEIGFQFNVQQVNNKFPSQPFILSYVVAEVQIINQQQNVQIYKFIYDQQQVNLKGIKQQTNRPPQKSPFRLLLFILFSALLGIALFLLIKFVIKKFKTYRQRKHNKLNQQNADFQMKYNYST